MNLNRIILISLILLIFSLTAVSAADINETSVQEAPVNDNSFLESVEIPDSNLGSGNSAADINETSVQEAPVNDSSFLESVEIPDSNLGSQNSAVGTFDDLAVEINNAPAGFVLDLSRDYNGDVGSRIHLDKDLTIDGHGHTLNCVGKEGCSAFYSSSGNIILKNLKIVNGHNDNNNKGGAIYITGSAQYTLENCIFAENWAKDYGGAIYNDADKTLTIKDCEFKYNTVKTEDGGAIYSKGKVYIENSLFDSNVADVEGGAIFANNDIDIRNSIFHHNSAKGASVSSCNGGAIRCKSTVDIDNSTFSNNYAYDYGGAIYAKNVYINRNQKSGQSFNSFFKYNDANDDKGGAIYAEGNVKAVNVRFAGNHAEVDGGAVYSCADVSVDHCLFESNKAKTITPEFINSNNEGGAIFAKETANVNNCTFNDNFADNCGGAIYAKNVNVNTNQKDSQSFFIDNEVETMRANFHDYNGGAIYAEKGVNVFNAKFIGNKANVDGGAIYSEDYVKVTNCDLRGNIARGITLRCFGGAIRAKGNVFIDNCSFVGNFADNRGGAVYAETVTFTNSPSLFENNYAREYGGAIYTDKFTTDMSHLTFINNTADKNDGGAIYINSENWITFTSCVFSQNHCGHEGGAIYLDSSSAHLSLKNNIFINNRAGKEGQCVFNCGVYKEIANNFWGGKNPGSGNDVLVEWISWAWSSNERHADSNPLKMDLVLDCYSCINNDTIHARVNICNSNGELFLGDFNIDSLFFTSNLNFRLMNVVHGKNTVSVDIIPEEGGMHTISANLYGYSLSKTLNVTQIDIIAPEISTKFDVPNEFMIHLDGDKEYVANQKVTVSMNSVVYEICTDENGDASLYFNSYALNPGTYNILVNVYNVYCKSTITIYPDIVIFAPEVSIYCGGQYKIRVNGDKRFAANQKVTVSIGSAVYEACTDENGYATININDHPLAPGKYPVSVDVLNINEKSEIEILPSIVAEDIVRTYGDSTPFDATFLDSCGTYLPNCAVVQYAIDNSDLMFMNVRGDEGYVPFNIAFLGIGCHVITIFNPVTKEFRQFLITIIPQS